MGWRYIAQRLNGDGTATTLDWEVPLSNVSMTDTLSGPSRLTGTIPVEVARLKQADGKPLMDEWSTAIWAEADGVIRGGGILVKSDFQGSSFQLDCMGFCGYPTEMPYTDSVAYVQVDPIDIVRNIWTHIQGKPGGNLGLVVDGTLSGKKIGTVLQQVQFDTVNGPVAFEAGPYKLNWYQTDDLGKEIDDLAKSTPFDYHEKHYWNGNQIAHRLEIGYPRLGRRRDDLRFVVGENIFEMPTVERDGDLYANEVLTLGAGEGRDMVRGQSARPDGRLRRVAVVTDKTAKSILQANAIAKRQLAIRQGLLDVTEILVRDHPHARIGTWGPGDEIRVMGKTGWVDVDLWCRVISSTISPERGDMAVLSLLRADRVGQVT